MENQDIFMTKLMINTRLQQNKPGTKMYNRHIAYFYVADIGVDLSRNLVESFSPLKYVLLFSKMGFGVKVKVEKDIYIAHLLRWHIEAPL